MALLSIQQCSYLYILVGIQQIFFQLKIKIRNSDMQGGKDWLKKTIPTSCTHGEIVF